MDTSSSPMTVTSLPSLGIMREPACLIASQPGTGQLQMVAEAVEELQHLDKPCVVVAIAGIYRTGKSYLLNRLAGRRSGESDVCICPVEPDFAKTSKKKKKKKKKNKIK